MDAETRDVLDEAQAYLVALRGVAAMLAEITHRLAPDDVERKLRTVRILVQETEAGRHPSNGPVGGRANRIVLDLLEEAVARSGED